MKKCFFVIITVFSFLVVAAAAFADSEYDAALKDYAGRNYQEAVIRFKAYVGKRPDPAAYYLLGYSLYKLGRFNEATEYFKQAYLIDPTFSPEKLGLAKEFPKVRTKRITKRTHGHTPPTRGQKKAQGRKKPVEAKKAAYEKCPAPPKKPATRKTP
jgi:tetratricopeptide (TPR) repeat protein